MRFWQAFTLEPLEQRRELCQLAESLGFTGVAIGDNFLTPADMRSPYPYTSDGKIQWNPDMIFPDSWQAITAMASATSTLEFMTSIHILPLREVFSVAKALSTAAVLSNNRITFGVGVGLMREEFLLTGHA